MLLQITEFITLIIISLFFFIYLESLIRDRESKWYNSNKK